MVEVALTSDAYAALSKRVTAGRALEKYNAVVVAFLRDGILTVQGACILISTAAGSSRICVVHTLEVVPASLVGRCVSQRRALALNLRDCLPRHKATRVYSAVTNTGTHVSPRTLAEHELLGIRSGIHYELAAGITLAWRVWAAYGIRAASHICAVVHSTENVPDFVGENPVVEHCVVHDIGPSCSARTLLPRDRKSVV